VFTRVAAGRARVVREVRAAAPLMTALRAPVTARGPWLTAVLNVGAAHRFTGRPVAVVVEPHPELHKRKLVSVLSDPLLYEEHRSGRIPFDEQRNGCKERGADHQSHRCHEGANHAQPHGVERASAQFRCKDQMTGLQLVQNQFARQSFIQMDRVLDLDPLSLCIEQRFDGQTSSALVQGHDDSVRLRNRPQSPVQRSDERHPVLEHAPRLSGFHQVENAVSPPLFHFSGDCGRKAALSENEDVFYKGLYAHGMYSGSVW
jgi:hypothetical protein